MVSFYSDSIPCILQTLPCSLFFLRSLRSGRAICSDGFHIHRKKESVSRANAQVRTGSLNFGNRGNRLPFFHDASFINFLLNHLFQGLNQCLLHKNMSKGILLRERNLGVSCSYNALIMTVLTILFDPFNNVQFSANCER